MKNWKEKLQVGDMDRDQRFEMTCKDCGHMHYLTVDAILIVPSRKRLYLHEIEQKTKCKSRGCNGATRLAMVRNGDASAFIGGLP